MDIFKIIIISIIICFLVILLKQIKPEYSLLCLIFGSIFLLLYIMKSMSSVFVFFNEIIEKTNINKDIFTLMIKLLGIGYLVEFASSICIDSGNSAIADKILLAGKISIFLLSMPIISNLFNLIMEFVK